MKDWHVIGQQRRSGAKLQLIKVLVSIRSRGELQGHTYPKHAHHGRHHDGQIKDRAPMYAKMSGNVRVLQSTHFLSGSFSR